MDIKSTCVLFAEFLIRSSGSIRLEMYGVAMAFSGIPISAGGAFAEKIQRRGGEENGIVEHDVCF